MNLSEPSSAIVPSLDGPVLLVLARSRQPLSARAIARLARRGSPAGVNKVLHRLVGEGVVTTVDAAPAILYELNRDHLAAPAVQLLLDLRSELVHRLREHIRVWDAPPVFASLFGSAARGDGGPESDLDLFLLRPRSLDAADPKWSGQAGGLAKAARRWTGNQVSVIEVGVEELEGPGAAFMGRVVRSVLDEGIALYGTVPSAMRALRS